MNRRGFLGLLAGGTATLVAAAAEASTRTYFDFGRKPHLDMRLEWTRLEGIPGRHRLIAVTDHNGNTIIDPEAMRAYVLTLDKPAEFKWTSAYVPPSLRFSYELDRAAAFAPQKSERPDSGWPPSRAQPASPSGGT